MFELTDALLCMDGPVVSPVDLTLVPKHRRGHGTLYGALNHGRIDVDRLRSLPAAMRLARFDGGRLVPAVDVSPWLRSDAPCSADRLFCHVYGRAQSASQSVPGQPYSFLAVLEPGATPWTGSWTWSGSCPRMTRPRSPPPSSGPWPNGSSRPASGRRETRTSRSSWTLATTSPVRLAAVPFNSLAVSCDCLAHVYGNAASADQPDRQQVYPSDMTDAEGAAVRSLLLVRAWLEGQGDKPEGYCHRQMIDAVRYLVDNGAKWRSVPADSPVWDRVYAFFRRWRKKGLVTEFHDRLRARVREAEGRLSEPTAGIIDSQSVPAAASGSAATRGYDGCKKVPGRKRHVITAVSAHSWWSRSPPRTSVTARPPCRPWSGCEPGTGRSLPGLGRRRLHRSARRLGEGQAPPHLRGRQAR
ncbi:transposase [Streptomyces sp. 3211]|uniref:transposase n=1 Tax=Streptomyces sp. 3211 TaxID=1964449 RepID=UPI001331AA8C